MSIFLLLMLLFGFFSYGAVGVSDLPPDRATMECQLAGDACPAPIPSSQVATCCPIDVQLSDAGDFFAAGGASIASSDPSKAASECPVFVVSADTRDDLTLDLDTFGCARWSLPAVAETNTADAAGDRLRAPCSVLRAPCSVLRAPCSVLRAPCSVLCQVTVRYNHELPETVVRRAESGATKSAFASASGRLRGGELRPGVPRIRR